MNATDELSRQHFQMGERSGSVVECLTRDLGFQPHCVVSLSKNIKPSLLLVQPRKTLPFINERLLMGRKESNKQNFRMDLSWCFNGKGEWGHDYMQTVR